MSRVEAWADYERRNRKAAWAYRCQHCPDCGEFTGRHPSREERCALCRAERFQAAVEREETA